MICTSGVTTLDLLQPLHVMHPGNLPHSVHNFLQVFKVGDLQDYIHAGLPVLAAGLDVADIGVGVADDGGDLFQHAEAVVTRQGEFDGIGNRLAILVPGPEHVDAPVGFVEKIGDVRTINGVDGNAFAAGNIADDGLSSNGIATACSVDQEVALSSNNDGVAVGSEDAPHHAGEAMGCGLFFAVR